MFSYTLVSVTFPTPTLLCYLGHQLFCKDVNY